jgi:hypothetical protein
MDVTTVLGITNVLACITIVVILILNLSYLKNPPQEKRYKITLHNGQIVEAKARSHNVWDGMLRLNDVDGNVAVRHPTKQRDEIFWKF